METAIPTTRTLEAGLKDSFDAFCNFGAGNAGSNTMDSARFAKLFKDCKLVDTRLSVTSLDLIFSKVKAHGERRIAFPDFLRGVQMAAHTKYGGDDSDGLARMAEAIATHRPSAAGTSSTATSGGIFSKLTDASLYTGAHKERFDGDGHGRGLAGRESVGKGTGNAKYHGGKVNDLSQICRPNH